MYRHQREICARLLLFLWRGDDRQQAATALSDFVGAVSDPSVVLLGMLNGWAADTAAVEAERAGLVGQEKQTAVMHQNLGGVLVGIGLMQQKQ